MLVLVLNHSRLLMLMHYLMCLCFLSLINDVLALVVLIDPLNDVLALVESLTLC
ncbi:hypothetical protein [Staphylococcus hominis]|uniref:hypothetical protein n=1 Tax=Staphylococcus hominis TaxID=1290 RepID=UPI003DA758FB